MARREQQSSLQFAVACRHADTGHEIRIVGRRNWQGPSLNGDGSGVPGDTVNAGDWASFWQPFWLMDRLDALLGLA